MKGLLYGLRDIVFKETLHIRRDPATLVMALMLPLIQLILFGYALDFDVRHIRTAVVDFDRTRESRAYVDGLRNTQYFDVVDYLPSPDAAFDALRRGDERVAIVIPSGFARDEAAGRRPVVRVLLDGSDSQVANPARSALVNPSSPGQSIGAPTSRSPAPDNSGVPDVRVDVLFNPDVRTQVYTIPGLVCVLLQLITVSLTSFSLVREREQGTLEQLMVSPVGRLGLMVGKLIPYSVIAFFELAAVLYLGYLIFDVRVAGSVLLLFVLSIPFILAALALGLFISTIAQNQAQALQFTLLTVLPSILLSGYISPRENLPGPLYILSLMLPVTHFIQICRAIAVRGAGLIDVMPSVLALVVIATVLIVASTTRFRKSVS